jgi:iron complex transport system substrate-binding protein
MELDELQRQRIMATLRASGAATATASASQLTSARTAEELRIVSLLPAATEMTFALGLDAALVGVSHECNFPPAARDRLAVVKPALELEGLSQRQIDSAVSRRLASGKSLYDIDEQRLRQLRPNLILTQDLCQVCAPSGHELSAVLAALDPQPKVLAMTPRSLADIFENVRALGRATAQVSEAERLVSHWRERLACVDAQAKALARTRMFFMEWADPVYCCGHWVPEMIELAGGVDALGRSGSDSVRVPWEQILQWAPELLIVGPCGCNLEQAWAQMPLLWALPGWAALPAVRSGRVFCVDADAYFARPGPRIVEGAELLAHLIHPERFEWRGAANAYRAAAAAE